MIKNIRTGIFLAISAMLLVSCNDNEGDTGREGRHFTKATVSHDTNPADTSPLEVTIALSDAEIQDERVSMIFVFDAQPDANGYITLPEGKYEFASAAGKSILDSPDGKFVVAGKNKQPSEEKITGGSVTVTESYGKYVFSGNLSSASTDTYEFTYSGRFEIRVQTGGENVLMFDRYELSYDNRFIKSGVYTHALTLTVENGDVFGMELFSEPGANYSYMADGTYTLASVQGLGEPGTIDISDKTYYYSVEKDKKYGFVELEVTTGYTDDGKHSVMAEGILETGDKFSAEFATESGRMCAAKAYLSFSDMMFYVMGQVENYTTYQYYFMIDNRGGSKGLGEELLLFPQGPINRYYEYLPVPSGRYTSPPWGEGWIGDRDSFKPFRLITENYIAENGIRMTDKAGNDLWLIIETGDDSYLDIECEKLINGNYMFGMSGVLFTYKAASASNPDMKDGSWPATEVHFKYSGIVADADWYHRHTHPMSTATGPKDFTDYFTEAMFWRAGEPYWDWWGSADGTDFILLTFKNDDGDWYVWDSDSPNNNIYYMHIALNIPPGTPYDEIPVGTYTCDDTYTFRPGTFMQGTKYGWDNYFISTMIFNESLSHEYPFGYGRDGGTITVAKDGDEYTITWDCYDDKGPNGNKLTGRYIGEVWDEDEMFSAPPATVRAGYRIPSIKSKPAAGRNPVVRVSR